MNSENAIDTVARHFLRNAVFDAIESGRMEWAGYPELGSLDWGAVCSRACQLADQMDRDRTTYLAAYALLEKRAEGVEA